MVMAPSATTTALIEDYGTLSLKPFDTTTSGIDNLKIRGVANNGISRSREMIGSALKKRVEAIDEDTCAPGDEDAFFVADMGQVYRQHLRWKKNLQRVKPHYAVKCNPDPQVLRLLAELGTGFDCASKAEIEQVLRLGVSPDRIIYAQPCKTKSFVRYAAKENVRQMTFDNADELYKIKDIYPNAKLFLRILTDDSASLCRLSLKFGASLDTTGELLALAKELDLDVVGVAFHVGSGASDPEAFLKAVRDARFVFDQAAALGYDLKTLDVGGGFVSETFEDMAAVLSAALDTYFPPTIRVIGEPGRFYVSQAFTIACNVIARRAVEDKELGIKSYMLYLNDGVYGNFSSIMFDHQHPVPQVLKAGEMTFFDCAENDNNACAHDAGKRGVEYSVWGPTCDGIDCISASWSSSFTLDVGDWLYFEEMGAYTKCSATKFNGFSDSHDTIYVSSEPGASALLGY
ncbi:pyridoxal-dependent decarboxylase [Elsinoe ampelina]|uniref:Ornithine decarboxylase n=1 Tax=Elsinoe ampelina TaxID=302913 RepID=A0A6A6G700_9PEZI|nr:pyridoxal-dependent decarboxylase [Elsinoe ampelina]